ncbi:membrane metallo-endopeptidase-like 1 [Amphiura filiformis]|uniref:membrane metallo-endopeptidase-like 1 n=1 Tax=Amphiura filiformis TaxID=82378 RepID=UPI003B21D4C1
MMEDNENRPKNKNYGVCAFWCLMMLLLLVAGLVFAIVYLTLIGPNTKAEEVQTGPVSTVCNNTACVSLAHSLLQTMDSSVDPCNDFYDYACGNWIKNTIVPDGHDQAKTMYSDIDRQQDLRVLLEAPYKSDEPEAVKKARTLYDSCMDKETREANGINIINGGTEAAFGGWPVLGSNPGGNFNADNFDMTAMMTGLFVYAGSTSIARATAKYYEDSKEFKLEISAGTFTAMPNIEYLVGNNYQKERDALVDYMTNVALILGANPAIARPEMEAVVNLEKKLALAYLDNQPTPDNVMTVREMQAMYPDIDWTVFLTTLIPESVATITDDFKVVNVDGDYLTEVFRILSEEPARLIADWMLWLCDKDATPYLNDELRNAHYEFMAIVEGTPDREYYQDCVDVVHTLLPSATARLYADANLPTESQTLIDGIAENIRTTLTDLIGKSSSFMVVAAKEATKAAVKEAIISVGVPDYVRENDALDKEHENLEYPAEGSDIFQNFLAVLAFRIQQNVALLRVDNTEEDIERLMGATPDIGITQPPVFSKDYPWYVNYGNLGALIASKLTLATEPADNLGGAASCLWKQYGQFSLPENGRTPLGDEADIIADNAGLQVATEYFIKQLTESDKLMTLTGLDLTQQQLFFLNNAQLWCEKYSYDYADEFENVTPGRFRVEGMMQNSAAFSEAFKCSTGNRMNPASKCVVL